MLGLLAKLEVAEIGAFGVDQRALRLRTARRDPLEALHLSNEGGHVFEAGFSDLIAKGDEIRVVAAALVTRAARRPLGKPVEGAGEQGLFLERHSFVDWLRGRRFLLELFGRLSQ